MKLSEQGKEIVYYIVNSLLAGGLVFLGACTDGKITLASVGAAAVASAIVAISQFKRYWDTQESEYNNKRYKGRKGVLLFNFVG
jgi:hypothetical protein